MIYLRLAGGLGNQLFQLAAALEIQLKSKQQIAIYLDALRQYDVKRVPSLLSIIDLSKDLIVNKEHSFKTWLLKNRFGRISIPGILPYCINNDTISKMSPSSFYLLDGYFQKISDIPNGFNVVKSLIGERAKNDKSLNSTFDHIVNEYSRNEVCAIHVRRGDYVNNTNKSIYPTLEEKYYKESLSSTGLNIKKIVVFSDEEDLHFDFFRDYEIYHVSELSLVDYQEFLLMSLFDNIIIANSTFSFWASVANSSSNNKLKIAPSPWSFVKEENTLWINNLKTESFSTLNLKL